MLDLFAGNNKLWGAFETDRYYGIEKQKGKGRNLYADNRKVIPTIDLSAFNIVDCDSYGIPVEQIYLLLKNKTLKTGTVIIYTCIGNELSAISKRMCKELGIEKLYRKCKVLFNARSDEYFYAFLYKMGVRRLYEKRHETKNFKKKYGYFII